MTIISLNQGFNLNPYLALGNKKEEKYHETFKKTFKLSRAPLNLVKHVNRSDFKIPKQISPVTV